MSRLAGLLLVFAMLVTLTRPQANEQFSVGKERQRARGVVFHDANENRKFDAGERPLEGVRVSNGSEIVSTGADGRYELPVGEDTILFVIKPRGWRTPLSPENLPEFYYLHKPAGSPVLKFPGVDPTGSLPESVDFPLSPQEEPEEFQAILFGDTQPRNQQEVDWIAHDVIEELVGTDASFGVTLGDIVFDDLNVMPTAEPAPSRCSEFRGTTWSAITTSTWTPEIAEPCANETFERIYGPSYYSFDYGPVHFLVVDNIEWYVRSPRHGNGFVPGRNRSGRTVAVHPQAGPRRTNPQRSARRADDAHPIDGHQRSTRIVSPD